MVAKPRGSRRSVAELSFLLRAILDQLAVSGGPKGRAHRAALDLADAFARGEVPAPEALAAAREAVGKAVERLGVASPPAWKALSWLPIEALLQMVERGDDLSDLVLTHAGYALSSLDPRDASARLEALRAAARTRAAALDDAPLPVRVKPFDEARRAEEAALLARSRAALSGEALSLFDFAQPERDAAQTIGRSTLAERLGALGLPASDAVLGFEETFGGLLLPITTLDDWREDRLYTLVGPWAMLTTHSQLPRGGRTAHATPLVPVARGPQEDLYFLDERGAPYYHETMGEPGAVPFGADGAELVARLVFGALTYAAQVPRGTAVFPDPSRVPSAASALGLTRLFADEMTEWWCGPAAVIVVFRGQVWALARTDDAFAALGG